MVVLAVKSEINQMTGHINDDNICSRSNGRLEFSSCWFESNYHRKKDDSTVYSMLTTLAQLGRVSAVSRGSQVRVLYVRVKIDMKKENFKSDQFIVKLSKGQSPFIVANVNGENVVLAHRRKSVCLPSRRRLVRAQYTTQLLN